MSQARSEEIMTTYLTDVVANGNVGLIPGFTAAEFVDHTQPELRGPAALTAHVENFRGNIPDLQVEVVNVSANENSAFGIWRWHGTPVEPMWGKSPSGELIVPSLIGSYFRFDNDMLVEYRAFLDAMDVLGQLA
jgi:predicted ester cyclase